MFESSLYMQIGYNWPTEHDYARCAKVYTHPGRRGGSLGALAAPRAVLPDFTTIRGGTGISWGRPRGRPGPFPVPPL